MTQVKKSNQIFIGLVAFCLVAVFVGWLLFAGIESTDDAQVQGHIVNVAPRIEGQVVKVYVNNDTLVQQGQPLVELDNSLQQANLDLAQANFEAAQANFGEAIINVKQSRSNFLAAQSSQQLELKNLQRVLNLKNQNAISQQAVDQQKNAYEHASSNFEAAKAVLHMSEHMYRLLGDKTSWHNKKEFMDYAEKIKGLNPSLDAALAKLKQAKANLDMANLNLSYTVIRAPFAGMTANKSVELGKNVNANVPLMSLVSLNDTWVVANYKEEQLHSMKINQKVKVKIDMYGSQEFQGIVTSIAPASGESFSLLPPDNASGNFVKVTQRFPVRIDFVSRPKDVEIRPGLSATTTVKIN